MFNQTIKELQTENIRLKEFKSMIVVEQNSSNVNDGKYQDIKEENELLKSKLSAVQVQIYL
jgi:hypothetical protein